MEIGWIAAHSPQAKGRIERFFGTAQDRLVKGLRLAQAASLEEANTYLEQEYLPLWNRSFTVVAANPTDAHRRLSRDRKSTRLNSSHQIISYAVFCLKKKKKKKEERTDHQ